MVANTYDRHRVQVDFENTWALEGTDTAVVFVTAESVASPPGDAPAAIVAVAQQACMEPARTDFGAKVAKSLMFYSHGKRVLLVGLGSQQRTCEADVRKATDVAVKALRAAKIDSAKFYLMDSVVAGRFRALEVMANTLGMAEYHYDYFLTDPSLKPTRLKKAIIKYDGPTVPQNLVRAIVMADSVCFSRDMGNHRADDADPAFYEEEAYKLAREFPSLKVEVLQFDDLKRLGMNLHAAVGQGAVSLPRLVLITYNGDPTSEKRVGLVGKGITFDTGGMNLKMTGNIEGMYMDMGGAAAVLGATRCVAALGLNVNFVTAMALAENAIDAKAYHPSSVLRSRKGLTVEILNTDAEGRLVLADALTYVQDTYKPDTILDFATLTGACIVALGEYAAGVFSNQKDLARKLEDYGSEVFERTWPLPILPEHEEEIKGKVSDICNMGKGRYGGASVAAAFLKRFIDDGVTWAHVDIAGPGMYSEDRGHMSKGCTGFGVQLITRFLYDRQTGAPAW